MLFGRMEAWIVLYGKHDWMRLCPKNGLNVRCCRGFWMVIFRDLHSVGPLPSRLLFRGQLSSFV